MKHTYIEPYTLSWHKQAADISEPVRAEEAYAVRIAQDRVLQGCMWVPCEGIGKGLLMPPNQANMAFLNALY